MAMWSPPTGGVWPTPGGVAVEGLASASTAWRFQSRTAVAAPAPATGWPVAIPPVATASATAAATIDLRMATGVMRGRVGGASALIREFTGTSPLGNKSMTTGHVFCGPAGLVAAIGQGNAP